MIRRLTVIILSLALLIGNNVIIKDQAVATVPKGAVAIRTDLWARLNDERVARHLRPLKWNGRLSERAASWSRSMARSGTFAHSDLKSLLGPYNYVGENIAKGAVSSSALHASWMRSPVHRDDMLAPGFTEAGIGIFCKDGVAWATVNFAHRWSDGPLPSYKGGTSSKPFKRTDINRIKC
jgi:uncharacterized protein YkwD